MAKFVIPAVLLFVFAFVQTGYAVKCYACDSGSKTECGDEFKKETIPSNECNPTTQNQEVSCMKITREEGDTTKIKRYCLMYPKGSKPCDYAASQAKGMNIKNCETCQEDNCNAAGSISASIYAIFGASLFAAVHFYQRA